MHFLGALLEVQHIFLFNFPCISINIISGEIFFVSHNDTQHKFRRHSGPQFDSIQRNIVLSHSGQPQHCIKRELGGAGGLCNV